MRILLINKHHRIWGGAERYYFELSNLLKKKGHQVAFFSMKDPENVRTKWSKYFVENIDFKQKSLQNRIKSLRRMFYSLESKRKIAKLLDEFKPDIVHIQNIYYYLSPSILPEIKKRGIPIVQTVHDYQLISPNVTFFHNEKICEITYARNYYKAIFHKCVDDSYLATLMATLALYIQNIFGFYRKYVDYYLTPSLFMKNKLIEYKLDPKKIIHIPNFTNFRKPKTNRETKEKYILYFGRIDEAKGFNFLLSLAKNMPKINIKIVGNPHRNYKFEEIRKKILRNVEIINYLKKEDLIEIINRSYLVIVPSLWYENQPYSILESYALKKPVVASNIGGIPEIVRNGKTGLLFNTGDIENCKEKILTLWNNHALVKKMGENAQRFIKIDLNPEKHYQKLMSIYQKVINNYFYN